MERVVAMTKPSVGVLLLASEWMREVGLDRQGGRLESSVHAGAERFRAALAEHCEVVGASVASTREEAAAAGRRVADAGVDAVLVAPMVWVEDQVARAALECVTGIPLILATLIPTRSLPHPAPFETMLAGSGTVGALQASGMLKREGRRFAAVAGSVDDPDLYRSIATHARAARAAAALRCRIGVLGGRCDAMSVTWVDDVGLRARYGVDLVPLEVGSLARAMERAGEPEIGALRASLARLGITPECDAPSLEQGMRAAIGITTLSQEHQLAGLAMNDLSPELHAVLGLRPCVPNPELCDRGFVVSMEADVAAVILMRALEQFTGYPAFYTEIFTVDIERNGLLMGHAGWHAPIHADPGQPRSIIPDLEYRSVDRYPGAAISFSFAEGPVTAVNAVWRDGGLSLSWVEGRSAGGVQMEGNCHLLAVLAEPVCRFLERVTRRGVSQHWVVVRGHHGRDLSVLAEEMGVSLDG